MIIRNTPICPRPIGRLSGIILRRGLYQRMRILQVCSAESLGGGERHVIDLTADLVARGHQLHLAVRPGSPLLRELATLPVVCHKLPLRNAVDLLSACRLAGLIRRHRIEVIHTHVARDYPVCGLAARLAGNVRLILTRHHFRPLRSGRLYRRVISPAAALVAVSSVVGERLREAFPELADRVVVIPNWIDPDACGSLDREESRRHLGISRPLAVAILGQISPLKRQDLFVESAIDLINHQGLDNADFLVIGSPAPEDEPFARQLRETVTAAGLSDRIHFHGYLDRLPAYLAAIDIVAVPSQNEAFSLVLVEAMAAGCAVIASRVGGMAEIVDDSVTGLFIPPDSSASLSAAIRRLALNPELRLSLAARARLAARQRFSRSRIIDRLEALCRGEASISRPA